MYVYVLTFHSIFKVQWDYYMYAMPMTVLTDIYNQLFYGNNTDHDTK